MMDIVDVERRGRIFMSKNGTGDLALMVGGRPRVAIKTPVRYVVMSRQVSADSRRPLISEFRGCDHVTSEQDSSRRVSHGA